MLIAGTKIDQIITLFYNLFIIIAGTGDQKIRLCDLKTAKATHSLIGTIK
jgi:hypothetical protein